MSPTTRNYPAIIASISPQPTVEQTMQHVVDVLWIHLSSHDVSWVGFYIDQPDQPDASRMILGPSRNSPACSPIGLHGVCGQALTSGAIQIVDDVKQLGENYIACDPRDAAEIVLPLLDTHGTCWGVLDVDSWLVGAFDQRDAQGLRQVLDAAGL